MDKPNILNPDSTVIQQLKLDTHMGMQRLLQILLVKMDPMCRGIFIDQNDVAAAVAVMTEQGRNTMAVVGQNNGVLLRNVTRDEAQTLYQHDKVYNGHGKRH